MKPVTGIFGKLIVQSKTTHEEAPCNTQLKRWFGNLSRAN
jgi:hypothetical protein